MKTVAELTGDDMGRTVEIFGDTWRVEGRLRHLEVNSELIHDYDGGSRFPDVLRGPTTYRLFVGPWEGVDILPDTPVRVQGA